MIVRITLLYERLFWLSRVIFEEAAWEWNSQADTPSALKRTDFWFFSLFATGFGYQPENSFLGELFYSCPSGPI
jgi:hypothetical protein